MNASLTLQEFFQQVYRKHHFWLKSNTIQQYEITLRLFDAWHGKPIITEELSAELLLGFLRSLMSKSAITVNNKREMIFTLWKFAHRLRFCKTPTPDAWEVRKLPEIKPIATAWSMEELRKILDACDSARELEGWNSLTWRALILTIYDTSHRLSSVLSARREDLSDGFLTIRGEFTKQKRDVVHKLAADTLSAIESLPKGDGLLFLWPMDRSNIWREFKKILQAANLPCGRRDLFHRLRRTSATHLAAVAGIEAAEQHLDHRTPGLARSTYIDPRFMPQIKAADVLPRP